MTEHDKTEQAYKNGYAKGFEDGKPKWIPVTERLPERWQDVLVCRGDYDISLEWRNSKEEWAYDNDHNPAVTHWMPLPDAPEEGNEDGK